MQLVGIVTLQTCTRQHGSLHVSAMQVSKLRAALIMRMAEQGITDGAHAFVEGILHDLETSWSAKSCESDHGSGQVALESS